MIINQSFKVCRGTMSLFYFSLFFFILVVGSFAKEKNSTPGLRGEKAYVGIINGNKTSISKFPYMVSLVAYGTLLGSGVILNNQWVMTTAYNAAFFNKTKLVLRVGSSSYNKSGQVLQVDEIVYPKKYKGDNYDWNLALLKLTKPVQFGKKIKAVKIADKDLASGAIASLVGWGPTTTNDTAPPSSTLVTAGVTVLDKKTCSKAYKLTPRLMCTNDAHTGPTAYDWGDPLVVGDTVYGLYAQQYKHCPALYTDISNMRKWINKHTQI